MVVGDELITQCVRDIRKALGDDAQQLLKTVPKRGYLLAAEVAPAESTAPTPRVERRLAAILAADIVGYSRLIEQDEAGTLAAIKGLREQAIDPLLAEHKGRIVKLMGDGAIVEFASVVDAVACAVAVQKAVGDRQAKTPADRRIVFRIGVNLGDVVVEGDDLLGDGVNVAARLEQLCEPGGVLVSGTAFDHLQGRLGLPLEFTGEQQVKNIARPVRAYRVRLDGSARRLPSAHGLGRQPLMLTAAAVLFAAVFLGGIWKFWPVDPPPAKPSLAVLPLDNLAGDEATSRFADGLTEDIITDLARFGDLDVIARRSVEAYKGKAIDVRQVGRDLNVRYVLEGSIQRLAGEVRVTAQLIDARTGAHVWSDRWDRPAREVFAIQTELSERVAARLAVNVIQGQSVAAAHRKPPEDLEAYDLVLLAYEAQKRGTRADIEQGLAYVDAAIAQDPAFARAYTRKAWLLLNLPDPDKDYNATYAEMERLARKALELDPNYTGGHITLAFAESSLGNNDEARASTARALELNPSSADTLNQAAEAMPYYGEPERGAELCERSFRLNPNRLHTTI